MDDGVSATVTLEEFEHDAALLAIANPETQEAVVMSIDRGTLEEILGKFPELRDPRRND